MARQRFEEGVKLFDRGEYKQAQAAFLQAWVLKQHPAVLLNLAQSELRSGDHVPAARHFATYLRDYPDTPAKERAAAQQGLAEARKHTGQLEIVVETPGAEVFVGGESVGRTPLPGPIDVSPGSFEVLVRLAGAEPTTETGSVEAGRSRTVRVELALRPEAPPATKPAPVPVEPPPPPDAGRQPFFTWAQSDPVAWATLGTAGLGLGVGTVFAFLAHAKANDADSIAAQITAVAQGDPEMSSYQGFNRRSDPCASPVPITSGTDYRPACSQLQEDLDTLDSRKTMMWVGFGVGAAGAIGTGVAYYLRTDSGDESTKPTPLGTAVITPVLAPNVGGLHISGSF
jgi:tetratricopeptide (TPR) repeat protein